MKHKIPFKQVFQVVFLQKVYKWAIPGFVVSAASYYSFCYSYFKTQEKAFTRQILVQIQEHEARKEERELLKKRLQSRLEELKQLVSIWIHINDKYDLLFG